MFLEINCKRHFLEVVMFCHVCLVLLKLPHLLRLQKAFLLALEALKNLTCFQVMKPKYALKNLWWWSSCFGCLCRSADFENILLLHEQNRFLNSAKRSNFLGDSTVSSSEVLSLVTPSDSTDLRTGKTWICSLSCERSAGSLHMRMWLRSFFST